ncbi:hypothetical protein MKW98_026608, partial [Papaver atlanticum]
MNPVSNLTVQNRWLFEMNLEFSMKQDFRSIILQINKVVIEENVIDALVEVTEVNGNKNTFKMKVSGFVCFKEVESVKKESRVHGMILAQSLTKNLAKENVQGLPPLEQGAADPLNK